MKKKYWYIRNGKKVEKEYSYIPVRYIFAALLTIFEILAVIGIMVALCYFIPYFYLTAALSTIICVLSIIAREDNPDYKVPWLLFVLVLPIAGFLLYLIFYTRKLKPKFIRRLKKLHSMSYDKTDEKEFAELKAENPVAYAQAKMLTEIADTHLFTGTKQTYFPLGEDMHRHLLEDLKKAQEFIYMEYFIIEEGTFWDSILEILKEKAKKGVDIKVLYDDIGCMSTLPGNYHKQLGELGIGAVPFSRLKGNADSEFNNRSHRKITVIDGKVGYTGGINLADEYINEIEKYGHWKDTAIRLEGNAVWELTKLFLIDFGINTKEVPTYVENPYPTVDNNEQGYVIPFGDGPRPIYQRRVGKSVIQNILAAATDYVYMTSPYLIIDNELCTSIENAALRGVDVRIILPHIPDKKMVFSMTRSFYPRLIAAGVKIYEYTAGFMHAKSYIADDKYAMIGTINLDYRSLVHHFENGVWLYNSKSIQDMKSDIEETLLKSEEIKLDTVKVNIPTRFMRTIVRIFAPML